MRLLQKLANERFARSAAQIMKFVCYYLIFILVFCTVLSFMGRQIFTLHAKAGTFEGAILAEENHWPHSRSMTVLLDDDIHVWTNADDQIDLTIQIGLSLIFAVTSVPMIFAFWFLSRVFSNIRNGQIFTEQNAVYLLYYGLLQFFATAFAPFIKLLICWFTNQTLLVSEGRMSISVGKSMFKLLFPSIAFIVAAYIIHYGVHLQDEVDHTL